MSRTAVCTLVLAAMTIGPSIGLGIGVASVTAAPVLQTPAPVFGVNTTNWGGYVVMGSSDSVSEVTGSWIQPAVSCTHTAGYLGLWDGIDGFNSKTVEQGGTLAYCAHGHAHYSAWYEFFPAPSVTIPSLTVTPGSPVSVTVTFNSSATDFAIMVEVGNSSFTHVGTVKGAVRASAECIDERPQLNRHLTRLADFGEVRFGADSTSTIGCGATIGGITGPFGSFSSVLEVNMVDHTHHLLSSTSSLSSDGSSFTATWVASS